MDAQQVAKWLRDIDPHVVDVEDVDRDNDSRGESADERTDDDRVDKCNRDRRNDFQVGWYVTKIIPLRLTSNQCRIQTDLIGVDFDPVVFQQYLFTGVVNLWKQMSPLKRTVRKMKLRLEWAENRVEELEEENDHLKHRAEKLKSRAEDKVEELEEENDRLKNEIGKLKLENMLLKHQREKAWRLGSITKLQHTM